MLAKIISAWKNFLRKFPGHGKRRSRFAMPSYPTEERPNGDKGNSTQSTNTAVLFYEKIIHQWKAFQNPAKGAFCLQCERIVLGNHPRDGSNSSRAFLSHDTRSIQQSFPSQLPFDKSKRSMVSIMRNAKKGCPFCRHLINSFKTYFELTQGSLEKLQFLQIIGLHYVQNDGLSLRVDFQDSRKNGYEQVRHLIFPISAPAGSYSSNLGISRAPSFDRIVSEDGLRLLPEVCERLNQWIQCCVQRCDSYTDPLELPRRLLDVSARQERDGVQLINTESSLSDSGPGQRKYAALSHCWGHSTQQPIKTTRESLNKKLSHIIPIEDLPKTYRDAVTVCRSLRIPYLWIDSLCIIQDDTRDWERESPRMAKIYQQAFITIIPTVAESCNDGFLYRQPPPIRPLEIQFWTQQGTLNHGSYFVNAPNFTNFSLFYQDTAESKWGKRGWTFCERLFSTRRIYFGARAIHWSCRGFYSSELDHCLADAAEDSLVSLAQEQHSKDDMYAMWFDRFLEYSCREFTFWTDRLPAISALANVVAKKTNDQYLAGIWKSDMENELLWSATKFRDPVDPLTWSDYVAPSWSWLARARNAEINHAISHPNQSLIECVDFSVEPEGTNKFGRVRDGFIRLKGTVFRVSRKEITPVSGGLDFYCKIMHEGNCIANCCLDGSLPHILHQGKSQDAESGVTQPRTFFLLLIRRGFCFPNRLRTADLKPDDDMNQPSVMSGIVLVPSYRERDEYYRAGIFETRQCGNEKDFNFFDLGKKIVKII